MAKVLKSDFSARAHLETGKTLLRSAEEELNVATSRLKVFVGTISFIAIGVALAYGFNRYTYWTLEGALLLSLIWWATLVAPEAVGAHRARSQLRAIEIGLWGEESVGQELERCLPDDYLIINDISITSGDQETQIDHVVITPTEVLCIETKNWRGIYQRGRTGWLWQPLHRPAGRPRWHKDPQTQSLMHSKALGECLAKQGLRAKVQCLVVLANSETEWQGGADSGECPVLYLSELTAYIKRRVSTPGNGEWQESVANVILCAHIKRGDAK